MSLILEALRKSEADRRRGERPTLHGELPPSPASSRVATARNARWSIAAIAALVIAWVAYAWWPRVPVAPTPAPAPSRAKVVPVRPAAAPAFPQVRHLAPPAVRAPLRATVREVPRTPASATPGARSPMPSIAPAIAAPAPMPPPPSPVAAPGGAAGTLRLADLDPAVRKGLPPLKLSMHMWNDDPAQRFVILDGQRLREGDRIGDAVVTAITRDGVVLDWDGRRLSVPIR